MWEWLKLQSLSILYIFSFFFKEKLYVMSDRVKANLI